MGLDMYGRTTRVVPTQPVDFDTDDDTVELHY